jgi:hypothetical protein
MNCLLSWNLHELPVYVRLSELAFVFICTVLAVMPAILLAESTFKKQKLWTIKSMMGGCIDKQTDSRKG